MAIIPIEYNSDSIMNHSTGMIPIIDFQLFIMYCTCIVYGNSKSDSNSNGEDHYTYFLWWFWDNPSN